MKLLPHEIRSFIFENKVLSSILAFFVACSILIWLPLFISLSITLFVILIVIIRHLFYKFNSQNRVSRKNIEHLRDILQSPSYKRNNEIAFVLNFDLDIVEKLNKKHLINSVQFLNYLEQLKEAVSEEISSFKMITEYLIITEAKNQNHLSREELMMSLTWIQVFKDKIQSYENLHLQIERKELQVKKFDKFQGLVFENSELSLVLDNPDKIDVCAICLDELEHCKTFVLLTCQHYFHKQCIEKWILEKANCPICKREIYESEKIN